MGTRLHGVVVGIDVGGTKVKAGVVRPDGSIVVRGEWSTEADRGPEAVVKRMGEEVRAMVARAEIPWNEVVGVGAGWPAFLDVRNGRIEEAINLRWRDVPIVSMMERELGTWVVVDNDANAAALGEAWIGAGRGAKSVLCVTLGTGVGGGIVFEGSVYRGVSTMAGEIGHLPMKVDGEPCTCGRFGCLETLASATALVREGRRRGLTSPRGADTDLSAEDIFVLAARGDGEARDIVGEMVGWLARGLAAAANLLNPEVIVVGGGLAKAGDALFGPLEEQFRRLALPRAVAACRLMPAFLGNDAGLLGAARLAWRKAGIGN